MIAICRSCSHEVQCVEVPKTCDWCQSSNIEHLANDYIETNWLETVMVNIAGKMDGVEIRKKKK
jgi:hypothetical protein